MAAPETALLADLSSRCWTSRGGDPAIDWQGLTLSFAELEQRVAAERRRLRQLLAGSAEPCRIGILAADGVANLISGLALLGEGHTQAILPLPATAAERRSLARRFGLSHLLSAGSEDDHLHEEPLQPLGRTSEGWTLSAFAPDAWGSPAEPGGDHEASAEATATQRDEPVALLATTSGTTSGRPSLNPISVSRVLGLLTRLDWSPYDLLHTTLLGEGLQNHSARLFKLRTLLQGRAIVIRDIGSPLAADTFDSGCNGCPLPPYRLSQLLRQGELARWPRGFLCLSGSDHIPMDLRRGIAALDTVGLGITYATSQSGPLTWLPPEELLEEEESLGRPLANVTIEPHGPKRLDRGGLAFHEVEVRKETRLRLPGPDGTLVESTTVMEGFRPGDLLARSPRGALIFAGRSNDVFLFRTLLISPFEIEQVLDQRPEVKECLAFGAPSPSHGAVPMAAVVLHPDHTGEGAVALLEALRDSCRAQLGLRSPKKIVLLRELPRGPTGKPLRRVLAEAHALRG